MLWLTCVNTPVLACLSVNETHIYTSYIKRWQVDETLGIMAYEKTGWAKGQTQWNWHWTERGRISAHLKFFDSSHPCASLVGTDCCQGLHFSPSRIVWESLDGTPEVVVSVVWFVFSVTHWRVVLQTHCIGLLRVRILGAHFSVLALISPAHFIFLVTHDYSCSVFYVAKTCRAVTRF